MIPVTNNFVMINDRIVQRQQIRSIDLANLSTETVIVYVKDGSQYLVTGFAALELIWLLKPSVLEGRTDIRFRRHWWSIHNLIAHPVMQILAYCRLYKWAIWIHDVTVPKPIGFKK